MLGALLLCLQTILCAVMILEPRERFHFGEEFDKDTHIRFSFEEESGYAPKVLVKDEKNNTIGDYYQESAVIHTKVKANTKLTFIFENPARKNMEISFSLSDVSKEAIGSSGPISESDVVSELKQVLEGIIFSQRKYIEKQNEYELVLKSGKKLVTLLLAFECVFSAAIVYYLHVETVKLFEKKRRI